MRTYEIKYTTTHATGYVFWSVRAESIDDACERLPVAADETVVIERVIEVA